MTKTIIAALSVFVIFGCSSIPAHSSSSVFSFDSVRSLSVGKTTAKEVVAKFGQPKSKSTAKNVETWNYETDQGGQLLTANVDHSSQLLVGLLLIPHDKRELKDSTIQAAYPGQKFQITEDKAHATDDRTPMLIVENTGAGVKYLTRGGSVEAIAWYDPNDVRKPSAQDR